MKKSPNFIQQSPETNIQPKQSGTFSPKIAQQKPQKLSPYSIESLISRRRPAFPCPSTNDVTPKHTPTLISPIPKYPSHYKPAFSPVLENKNISEMLKKPSHEQNLALSSLYVFSNLIATTTAAMRMNPFNVKGRN